MWVDSFINHIKLTWQFLHGRYWFFRHLVAVHFSLVSLIFQIIVRCKHAGLRYSLQLSKPFFSALVQVLLWFKLIFYHYLLLLLMIWEKRITGMESAKVLKMHVCIVTKKHYLRSVAWNRNRETCHLVVAAIRILIIKLSDWLTVLVTWHLVLDEDRILWIALCFASTLHGRKPKFSCFKVDLR